jgi:hypothetical protein
LLRTNAEGLWLRLRKEVLACAPQLLVLESVLLSARNRQDLKILRDWFLRRFSPQIEVPEPLFCIR